MVLKLNKEDPDQEKFCTYISGLMEVQWTKNIKTVRIFLSTIHKQVLPGISSNSDKRNSGVGVDSLKSIAMTSFSVKISNLLLQ